MKFLEKLDKNFTNDENYPPEKILNHKLSLEFEKLTHFENSKQLVKSKVFKSLENQLTDLIYGYEYGFYADKIKSTRRKSFLRAILWPLEYGENYNGILETLRNRALVRKADIYFLPSTDIGMARSGNRNVIRDLAIELGYNYFFVTSYLNLNNKVTNIFNQNRNRLGLEGNAIMTRFPMSNLRYVSLDQFYDSYKGPIKKIGCEKAILVDLLVDKKQKLTVVCINAPEYSSPRQRCVSIKYVLSKIKSEELKTNPILLGGDLKTSTYNCKTELYFLLSVINKIYRGFDFIAKEHHNFPEEFFEKRLFEILNLRGFNYDQLNEMGKGCFHCKPQNVRPSFSQNKNNNNKISMIIKKILKNHNEKLPYKYDWFAGNKFIKPSQSHQAERPKVISHLFFDGRVVSNHDPILLDFEIGDW